ncbi:MAG: hypothetical protein A2283_08910 [Lentisphaerae bacterium RIFOXYA12_FULL_48_11]|nr:MAG: hypothetical protein A2283_08910 [Lentisphaerae bacterium RIFOXYA12_FULL_48_11]
MNSFLEKLKEIFLSLGPVGWIAVFLAAFVLLMSGISLFDTPAYEILYSPMRMEMKANEKGELSVFYSIETGNTGTKTQEYVKMRFSRSAMDHVLVQPYARNFGVTPRSILMTNERTTIIIDLGTLESEKRVKLSFMLSYPKGQVPHKWDDLFLGAVPAKGKAKCGDPGMTLVGRAWFSLFGRWLPF